MTTTTGKFLSLLLLLILLPISFAAHSEVAASVDRQRIEIGDTFRLTLSANEDHEDLNTIDLSILKQDFELLQQATRSSTNIINGKRTHQRQLLLDLTPKRTGQLQIPALTIGGSSTRAIPMLVSKRAPVDPGQETVIFEAELDQPKAYVQSQVILTLRLQQAINLDARSISDLELKNAFVIPLEQNSFQRTINGRPWLVHEVRYAIFPEHSGSLEIPAQTFSGRERVQRRSLFDSSNSGRRISRRTEPLQIEILPRPANYPANATWLPAQKLSIEETWSSDPEQLRAGESITRTLTLRGTGLQSAQLPPLTQAAVNGLKYYPDQPATEDIETNTGLEGVRQDSTAIVPTRSGEITLPEVRIPWWDTVNEKLQYAVIPARVLAVAPAQAIATGDASLTTDAQQNTAPTVISVDNSRLIYWQLAVAFLAVAWLITLALLLKQYRHGPKLETETQTAQNPNLRQSYKQLLAACSSDNARAARRDLLVWVAAQHKLSELYSLKQASQLMNDKQLTLEIDQLENALYGSNSERSSWRGDDLASCVKRLQKQPREKSTASADNISLYPT